MYFDLIFGNDESFRRRVFVFLTALHRRAEEAVKYINKLKKTSVKKRK